MTMNGIGNPLRPIEPIARDIAPITPSGQPKGTSFQEALGSAIGEVESLQHTANTQIEDLMLGRNSVSVHDAMLSLEKADVAFQLMSSIRGKLIRAYEEIMRTQV